MRARRITLQFNLARDIDAAAQDVQATIARTLRQLPPGMPPPSYRKVNPADSPILFLASPHRPCRSRRSTNTPRPSGSGSPWSAVSPRCRCTARRSTPCGSSSTRRVGRAGLGLDEVTAAVASRNPNLPTGILYGDAPGVHRSRRRPDERAAGLPPAGRRLPQRHSGAPRTRSRVLDGVQNDKTGSWFDGTRAIVLAIQRQPGTNTVAVADAVKKALPDFRRSSRPRSPRRLYDRSVPIRDSVRDVKMTLLITLCLVVMVIFLFLRNLSATVIPSLALPLSIIGTFAAMYLLGYSMDNLSLMALTLCVGFVVDDAIVMLENVVRHLEMGKPVDARRAERRGRDRVHDRLHDAVVGGGVHPGALHGRTDRPAVPGVRGDDLHHDPGVGVRVADAHADAVQPVSAPVARRPARALYEATERVFQRVLGAYERSSCGPGSPLGGRGVPGAILVGTVLLFMVVPKGFIPTEDNGSISGNTETVEGTRSRPCATIRRRRPCSAPIPISSPTCPPSAAGQ